MKKMVLKVPLQHKAECFAPETCVVEKVVLLRHQAFEEMRANSLRDNPYIIENKRFMWCDAKSEHCVLFLDCEGEDVLLVQSEGFSYARRAQFIPGAKNLVYAAEMTPAEQRIHGYLADMVEEAAKQMHRGEESFSFRELAEEVTSRDLEDVLGQALAKRLQNRADVAAAEYAPLGIDYQPDIRVKPKELYTMRLITPLQIEAVSEDDFEDRYAIDPQAAVGCRNAINRFMQDYLEEDERDRGLMQYYDSRSPVSEKIWSAFPSMEVVDGRLMGVLTCQFSEPGSGSLLLHWDPRAHSSCSRAPGARSRFWWSIPRSSVRVTS